MDRGAPSRDGAQGEAPATEIPAREDSNRTAPERGRGDGDGDGDGDGERDSASGRRRKRRLRLAIFFAVAMLVLVGGGFAWWYFVLRLEVSTDDAFIDAQIVRIAPEVDGRLTDMAVTSNTEVTAGQILARIDPAAAQASYDQAKAALAAAKAGVTSAQAALEQARSDVTQSQSAKRAADIEAENDQHTLSRLNGLQKSSGNTTVSQQQLDDAEATARSAAAKADEAGTAVGSARASVDAAEAGVASAQAKLQQAQATVAAAQVTLDHLTIKAPMAGQIVQLNVNRGSYVQPGQEIMALVPKQVYVTANFKETALHRIRIGAAVDIAVDAYPDVDFRGHVVSIQRGAGQAFQLLPPQNATGNFVKVVQRVPVRIAIDSPDPSKYVLGPGMSVVPTVRTGG